MAELGLDRLALDELDVVEDQQVDAPQPLLVGERRLGLQGVDEAVHEPVGGQVDHPAPGLAGGVADPVQQVGLAQPDARVEIERVVERALPLVIGDPLGGGVRQGVRASDHEAREGQPRVERRAAEIAPGLAAARLGRRRDRGDRDRRAGRVEAGERTAGRAGLGDPGGDRTGRRPGPAHADLDPRDLLDLGLEGVEHAVEVVRLDPALEEAGRDRQTGRSAGHGLQLQAGEPAREHVLAELGPQPALHPGPGRPVIRVAATVAAPVVVARHRSVDTHHWLSRRCPRRPAGGAYARFTPSASRKNGRDRVLSTESTPPRGTFADWESLSTITYGSFNSGTCGDGADSHSQVFPPGLNTAARVLANRFDSLESRNRRVLLVQGQFLLSYTPFLDSAITLILGQG